LLSGSTASPVSRSNLRKEGESLVSQLLANDPVFNPIERGRGRGGRGRGRNIGGRWHVSRKSFFPRSYGLRGTQIF